MSLYNLVSQYQALVHSAVKFARAGDRVESALAEFRANQHRFVQILNSADVRNALEAAYTDLGPLGDQADAALFLREAMTAEYFDEELRLAASFGLKRQLVTDLMLEIMGNPAHSSVPEEGITADYIIDGVNRRCEQFVTLITVERFLTKKEKKKVKTSSLKMVMASGFGAICAVINAPLAIPTMGIIPTISLGMTASAAIVAFTYAIEMGNPNV